MDLGCVVDGTWKAPCGSERSTDGTFKRQKTRFRGQAEPMAGRYHLYVSHACPWAHRTATARALLGLDEAIGLSVVDAVIVDDGWSFGDDGTGDPLHRSRYLRDLYLRADPRYTGKVTVPVLWDKQEQTIVNNESREVLRQLVTTFLPLARTPRDLSPAPLRARIDEVLDAIYEPINNGVYRAGFATKQAAHEEAVRELFAALDRWDGHLREHSWLVGDAPTEADIALFTTLLRFDPVYHVHFKCNLQRIADYPGLSRFLGDFLELPGVRTTVHMDHIKRHYYLSHRDINPSGLVPLGPR